MKNGSFLSYHEGSSFFDFLARHYPELTPCLTHIGGPRVAMPQDLNRTGTMSVPHGTTVLALKYRDGAIIAGDRRATEGFQIADRRIEKVFRIDEYSAMAIAGAAGPCIEMARLFQTELEHYEKLEGVQLSCEGKANKLGQMVKANLPMVFQG
ncbi:MAG: proteasome subunit beta, partial [Nitrospira sp.]|nr:proteasome subunit beta [Nitrospira sp.]